MTEWARRIQASIESMNRLVDGFQLAVGGSGSGGDGGGRSSGSGSDSGSAGTVTTPDSSVSGLPAEGSPSSGKSDGDVVVHGGAQSAEGGSGGASSAEETRGTGVAMPSALSAYGLESFASAQLGFRRGLEGLVKSGVSCRTGFRGGRAEVLGGGMPSLQQNDSARMLPVEGVAAAVAAAGSGGSIGSAGGRVAEAYELQSFSSSSSSAPTDQIHHTGRASRRPADKHRSVEQSGEEEKGTERARGWEETKGGERGGERRATAVEREGWEGSSGGAKPSDREPLSRSSSWSILDRADAVLAAASGGGGGAGGTGFDYVGGDVGRHGGSVTSLSSSTSLGPDLEAEIASLEALAESLQQRKMRFEPKVRPTERGRGLVASACIDSCFLSSFRWCGI